jgi:PAS domain S-box-containing protein
MSSKRTAEKGTRAAAQGHALIMEAVPFQMWLLEDVETYGPVNQHHADFLGRARHEVESRRIDEVLPEPVVQECLDIHRRVVALRETVRCQQWIPDHDGRRRLIDVTRAPRIGGNGEVEAIVCLGVDITESREIEMRLAQSEENFRAFIETMDELVVIGDTDGRIVYCNPAASSRLGYSLAEMRSMRILDLHPERVRAEAAVIVGDMLTGKRNTCPLPLITKSGVLVPVETRARPGKWNGVSCIFGMSKDLSKEQEALQKFDRLFRMNPALMAVSRDRTFVDINDAFLRTFGYTIDQVVGKTAVELNLFVDPLAQEAVQRLLERGGPVREVQLRARTRDGRVREGLFSADVIESQGVRYVLTVMVDITERNLAEEERSRTIAELQDALEHIKTLRGILPICASCKRIRNDRGYWEQVEAYLSAHTDARFTHGLCPECVARHFPDLPPDEDKPGA